MTAEQIISEIVQELQISADQLGILADWLAHEPDVPDGKWLAILKTPFRA